MKNIVLNGTFARLLKLTLAAMLIAFAPLARAEDKANDGSKKDEDERFEKRQMEIQKQAMKAMYAEFEKGARQLQTEFPNRAEVYELLLEIANKAEGDKAKQFAQEIIDSKAASDDVKDAAKALIKKMGAMGKPVEIKYTAVDGREVDLTKMKDKVVLVDFWATWCGPCVKEIPNVKAVYEKLHDKGFEIVGISFDQKQDALEKFVKDKSMGWPQYFDGKGWSNKFGKEYGINSIPTMWLVDKKGNLRDVEAREDLAGKVEKLLAEK
jgi:thiol-disulfide isomerase/thioredoxin